MIEHYAVPIGIIAFIWLAYFVDRCLARRLKRLVDVHASINEQRKNLAEALLLVQYGARYEAIQLLREHFDLPQDSE